MAQSSAVPVLVWAEHDEIICFSKILQLQLQLPLLIGQLYHGCGSMMGSSPRFMYHSKSESYLRYGTEYYLYAPVNIFVLAWDAA